MENTPIEELNSISQVLHLAHHRNKNQHRLAKWWKAFSQLRRQIPKFISELEALNTAVSFSSSEQNKYVKAAREKVDDRVEFWREFLIPKFYVAFGNLVADNQYAVLGLMLVGILARVRTVLEEIKPEKESLAEIVDLKEVEPESRIEEDLGQDLGEVVKRVELFETPRERIVKAAGETEHVEKPKKNRKSEVLKTKATPESTPKKPKKKRKKGDAFDDLFDSLI